MNQSLITFLENDGKTFSIEKTSYSDLFQIWKIIESNKNFFDDILNIKTLKDFKEWYNVNVIAGIVGINIKNGEVIGCGYLTSLENRNACISLFMKRKAIPFPVAIDLYKKYMNYFIDKYDLKMIYAIVPINNKACLQLLKILGFKIVDTLKSHVTVNGKKIDCFLATYIRNFK